jgi:NAD(P)-dependent dehydrogenase (short-subunit alcohol dehydrogenase family)
VNSDSNTPLMLITGGSRGVGAATARLAAERGYDVALSYVSNESAALAVVADVRAFGRRALAARTDSADPSQIMQLFTEIDREFGRIDVLVNNAAIIAHHSRVEDLGVERMQRIFAVNSIGPMLYAQQAAKRMSHRHDGRGGVVINISSASARLGSPNEYVDYAASKGAIETFTTGFAKEVAREGIRVNCIRPGRRQELKMQVDRVTDAIATMGHSPNLLSKLGAIEAEVSRRPISATCSPRKLLRPSSERERSRG